MSLRGWCSRFMSSRQELEQQSGLQQGYQLPHQQEQGLQQQQEQQQRGLRWHCTSCRGQLLQLPYHQRDRFQHLLQWLHLGLHLLLQER